MVGDCPGQLPIGKSSPGDSFRPFRTKGDDGGRHRRRRPVDRVFMSWRFDRPDFLDLESHSGCRACGPEGLYFPPPEVTPLIVQLHHPGDQFDPHPRVGGGMHANGRRGSGEGSEPVAGVDPCRRRDARHGRRASGEQRMHMAAVRGGSLGNSRALPRRRAAEGDAQRRHGWPRQVRRGGGDGSGGGGHLRHGGDHRVRRRRTPPRHPVAISIPCRSPAPQTCRQPPSR